MPLMMARRGPTGDSAANFTRTDYLDARTGRVTPTTCPSYRQV